MTVYLLDINLLLALTDPSHVHHELAHRWFAEKGHTAWATCPITENGFLRIASHPHYPNRPGAFPVVYSILQKLCEAPGHTFWSEDVSIRDLIRPDAALTHAQITDIYLAGLAVHKRGKLATLDQHIPVNTIHGGQDVIELVTTY